MDDSTIVHLCFDGDIIDTLTKQEAREKYSGDTRANVMTIIPAYLTPDGTVCEESIPIVRKTVRSVHESLTRFRQSETQTTPIPRHCENIDADWRCVMERT